MKRIAIIEDDEATRFTLEAVLTCEGYDAIVIVGPGSLLAQLAAAKPDLLLVDLLLGAWGNGVALAGALRATPLLRQVPIIVLSAAPELLCQYAHELTDLRCQALAKPFDLHELLALIAGGLV